MRNTSCPLYQLAARNLKVKLVWKVVFSYRLKNLKENKKYWYYSHKFPEELSKLHSSLSVGRAMGEDWVGGGGKGGRNLAAKQH